MTEDKNSDLTVMLSRVEVLVVDDSRTLRRILIRELNTLGITHVVEASNGVEALAMAREKPPDLMLLDMEMPELDGLGVLQEMAKQSGVHHFPVIVVSGADQIEKTIACIALGAEDYLPKPFDPVLLKARIFSSLEKKRLKDLDAVRLQQLQEEKQLLEMEQMKTEKLMLNILPRSIAERLKRVKKILPVVIPSPLFCLVTWWVLQRCHRRSLHLTWLSYSMIYLPGLTNVQSFWGLRR